MLNTAISRALSQAHYDTDIGKSFAKSLKRICPKTGKDNALANLDLKTPFSFDKFYNINLLKKKGLLHSDQEFFNGGSTDQMVNTFAKNTSLFFEDFSIAMVKMDNIKPLTGSAGQIRINCRSVN
ncbi:hypothetical protein Q3G72_006591 [Acer saccharum]|nr:hypothetical protein Q3G72_006591 [Acer saccharum]